MNEYYGQGLHIVDYFTSYHDRPTSSPNAKPRKYWLRKVQHFLQCQTAGGRMAPPFLHPTLPIQIGTLSLVYLR